VGDDRHLLGEAFDMLRLLLEEGAGDEERKIAIFVAARLDPIVEQALEPLSDT